MMVPSIYLPIPPYVCHAHCSSLSPQMRISSFYLPSLFVIHISPSLSYTILYIYQSWRMVIWRRLSWVWVTAILEPRWSSTFTEWTTWSSNLSPCWINWTKTWTHLPWDAGRKRYLSMSIYIYTSLNRSISPSSSYHSIQSILISSSPLLSSSSSLLHIENGIHGISPSWLESFPITSNLPN